MSQIFAMQLTAMATAALAVFAVVAAVFALLAFGKQSEEVRAIEQQVKDAQELTRQQAKLLEVQSGQLEVQRRQFEQEQADRRRAQASRVFMWTETGPDPRATDDQATAGEPARYGLIAHVRNTSEQPIYGLDIDWAPEKPLLMEHVHFSVLMPGDQEHPFSPWPDEIDLTKDLNIFHVAPIARFRDAAGLHWLLTRDGALEEESRPLVDVPPGPDDATSEQP